MTSQQNHVAFCPHCGNVTPQQISLTHSYETKWYDSDGNETPDGGPECEAIICICGTCNEVLLYDGVNRYDGDGWPALRYPHSHSLDESVPAIVRKSYAEACRVYRTAPNAYAVLIRRSIERICDDKGVPAKGLSLADRLLRLSASSSLPPVIFEATGLLRQVGNAGAHSGDVSAPQTWAMNDLFRLLVEYVYVAPAKVAAFKTNLQKSTGSGGASTPTTP